jgi:hypothetical protein
MLALPWSAETVLSGKNGLSFLMKREVLLYVCIQNLTIPFSEILSWPPLRITIHLLLFVPAH